MWVGATFLGNKAPELTFPVVVCSCVPEFSGLFRRVGTRQVLDSQGKFSVCSNVPGFSEIHMSWGVGGTLIGPKARVNPGWVTT